MPRRRYDTGYFYETLGARPLPHMLRRRRDVDRFDNDCDHLLVLDHARGGHDRVVGTYRLLRGRRQPVWRGSIPQPSTTLRRSSPIRAKFSSSDAPASTPPIGSAGHAAAVEWDRGLRIYHDIALMFGCASLPGTDPGALALPLSYLYYYHLAPPALRPRALNERYVNMRRVAMGAIDPGRALNALPPLIKGYLRLGGFTGDGAVIDEQFNTTDVCILVKTDLITENIHVTTNGDPEIHGLVNSMGSSTLKVARLVLYFAWTLALMPVQWIGLALGCRWVSTLPTFYHRWCCRLLGFRSERSEGRRPSVPSSSRRITSRMPISRSSAH